jgi:Holliday junction DNA helicase RuvB
MLENVVGQMRAKQMLELMHQTFTRTGNMPPIGIFGPSGYGKTHLVTEWAEEIGAKIVYINGTAIRDALAFRAYFKDADKDKQNRYIVFIDECHMLPNKVQENLLSVLEQPAILCTVATKEVGNVQCVDGNRWIDKGDVMREALPPNLSFVFATTDASALKETIHNRLRKIHLEPYTMEDKIRIAMDHLANRGQVFQDMSIYEQLAKRSRSIRQLREELCEAFIDVSVVYTGNPQERLGIMDSILGIDADGAGDLDRNYLDYIANNGIASLATLAGFLKIDKQEIVDRIEPFLLEKQWIQITNKGRILTKHGRDKLSEEDDDAQTA